MTIADIFERFLSLSNPRAKLHTPAHTPLEQLSMAVLDCETTGLNPRRDRIVAIAAVAIETGLIVSRRPPLDLLVDPRMPIPARATAIHGIDDTRVAGAPTISDVWEDIVDVIDGRIVVGHHIGFDLAILAAEAQRTGRAWREPPHFDTAAMLAGLGFGVDRLDLAEILPHLGLQRRGIRHTALGDATMTADLFVALAHRLRGVGRCTFGGAIAAHRAPQR